LTLLEVLLEPLLEPSAGKGGRRGAASASQLGALPAAFSWFLLAVETLLLPLPWRQQPEGASGSRSTQWETRPPGKYPLMLAKLPHPLWTRRCAVLSRHFHPPSTPGAFHSASFSFLSRRCLILCSLWLFFEVSRFLLLSR